MIDDENAPEMIRAHQDLMARLGRVLGLNPRPLDRGLLAGLCTVVTDHRQEWRNKGVDFPMLVVVVVPTSGIVKFMRADLDWASVRVAVVNFVREHPEVPMNDVVTAFRWAYPDMKPGDLVSSPLSVALARNGVSDA